MKVFFLIFIMQFVKATAVEQQTDDDDDDKNHYCRDDGNDCD